jgi:hypothetical protein
MDSSRQLLQVLQRSLGILLDCQQRGLCQAGVSLELDSIVQIALKPAPPSLLSLD